MQPACFIHVFKAGGTSVSDWLCQHYPESAVPPDPIAFRDNPETYLSAPLVRGHIFARDVIDTDRIILTMVRRPEAQLMSALWHLVSGAGVGREHKPFANDSMLEQAALCAKTGAGMQSVFFSARFGDREPSISILDRIHVIGLTERLQDTLRLFAWKLRLPALREISHARFSGAGAAGMPQQTKDVLSDIIETDSHLYAYAERRFERDMAELAAVSHGDIDAFLDHQARCSLKPAEDLSLGNCVEPSRTTGGPWHFPRRHGRS